MDLLSLAPILDWVSAHPHWAGAAVALVAFSESLAVVGLVVPGVVFMFAAGALIGVGRMELWPTLVWAAAGAVAGDGVSFWLGRRYHEQLKGIWPLRNHPDLMARATRLFQEHGGKGVFLGRFIGPIRPVIPAVAGMLDMPAWRFVAVNVTSALLWAPAYLLPGIVFAASLDLAAEVAVRLATLLVVLAVVLFLAVWGVRRLFNFLHPRTHPMIRAVMEWGERHPVMGRLSSAVLDPEHPEARGLTVLALLLGVAGIAFGLLLNNLVGLAGVDRAVHDGLAALRTPFTDKVMVVVTELGDGRVLIPLFVVVLARFLWRRRWQAAGHWVAAGAFSAVLVPLLKWSTAVPRPAEYGDPTAGYAFPSGHVTHSIVVYGFLAVLLGRELPDLQRRLLYAVTGLLITAIAFSRLYLGAHWLSDALGGLTLGTAWIALLGIAYRRRPVRPIARRGLAVTAFAGLVVAASWNTFSHFHSDLERYAPQRTVTALDAEAWWQGGWRDRPAQRDDLGGDHAHPLTLQYAGDPTALGQRLEAEGWRRPPPVDLLSWLRWFAPGAEAERLPVLPQVHDGRHEALLRVRPVPGEADRMLALRLWRDDVRLTPDGPPLYLGNVSRLEVIRPLRLVAVPRTVGGFDTALEALEATELGMARRWVERADGGRVLLLRADAAQPAPAPATGSSP